MLKIDGNSKCREFGEFENPQGRFEFPLSAELAKGSPTIAHLYSYSSLLESFVEITAIFGKFGKRKTHIIIRHFTRPHHPVTDLAGANSEPMGIRQNDGAVEVPKYPTF